MSDELTIYISPDDDLTTVRERLEEISARRLTMVIPPQTQLRSHVAWKLLYARARELGKEVVIVSSDPQVRSVAHAVKFKVAYSLETPSATGKSRPGSRSARTTSSGGARTRTSPPVPSRPSSAKNASDPRSAIHSRRGTPNTRPPRTRPPEAEWDGDPQHRQQAENPLIGGPSSLPFDASSAKEYSQPYEFRIQAPPTIHPLSNQIEEPDLLLEDYTQAQDIRLAAREGQKRFPETGIAPDTRPEEATIAPDTRPEEAASSTQQPSTADDLFTNIEDSQPPHTEESSVVSLGINTNEHVTHHIEDVEELPDSVVDNVVNSPIEYQGDRDDIVPPPSSKPITYIEAEQPADHEEQENFPSRTYGVPSRRRRSSNLSPTPPTPSSTPTWQFEEDALPPIEERPIERRSSAPLPPRMSGNHPPGKIPPDPGAYPIPRTSVGRGQQTQARSAARPAPKRLGPRATQPRTATKQYATRGTTHRKTPVGIITAIVLLFAVCLLVYYGPTANTTISIVTQDYSKQITLTAKVGQQAQNIQAQQLSKVFTTNGTGTATGSQLVGTNPAQGNVIFTYHGSNPKGIVIPSGSIVTTSGDNAIQFATTAEVLVMQNKASPPVSVQAVKSGKDGNVDAGTITVIPNNTLTSIAQAQNPPVAISDLNLSVANDTATTGGGAKPTPAVTDQDLSNVKNNLRQQLQGEINAWQQQLSSIGAVGTPQITDTLINPPKVNDIEANGTFSATIKVTATVLLVRTADLQKEALKQINNAITNDKSYAGETILTDSNPAVTINQLEQTTADANSITFTFKATAKVGPRLITKEYVQQLIAGKPIPDAKSTLVNINGVKTADITVSPNFMPWVTLWYGHIDVTIQPATAPHQTGRI